MSRSPGQPQKKPEHPDVTPAETAAYVLDMCRIMGAMSRQQDLFFLAHLLDMAALEAAQVRTRLAPVSTLPPSRPSARDGVP